MADLQSCYVKLLPGPPKGHPTHLCEFSNPLVNLREPGGTLFSVTVGQKILFYKKPSMRQDPHSNQEHYMYRTGEGDLSNIAEYKDPTPRPWSYGTGSLKDKW